MGKGDLSDRLRAGEDPGAMLDAAEPIPEDDPPPDCWEREGDRPGAYLPAGMEPPPFDLEDPGAGGEGEDRRGEDLAASRALARVAALPWTRPEPEWFNTEPEPRRYVVHLPPRDGEFSLAGPGLLPRGKVGILAAGGGVGKTYALCGLALAITTGRRWLGRFPVPREDLCRRVVFIMGEEDPAELRRRLYHQGKIMGLDGEDLEAAAAGILALPGAGLAELALTEPRDSGGGATPFARALRDHLEAEAGEGWDAVLLDPLSRFAGPDVEADNVAATRLIQTLETLTTLPGSPVVLLAHHTSKDARKAGTGDDTAVRGSSAIVDGARWVGNLLRKEPPADREDLRGFSTFHVSKNNYGPPFGPKVYLRAPEGARGAIRAATPEETETLAEAEREAAEQGRKEPKPPGPRAGGRGGKAPEDNGKGGKPAAAAAERHGRGGEPE